MVITTLLPDTVIAQHILPVYYSFCCVKYIHILVTKLLHYIVTNELKLPPHYLVPCFKYALIVVTLYFCPMIASRRILYIL